MKTVYIMHFLYEEKIREEKKRRISVVHGLDKQKIFDTIKAWKEKNFKKNEVPKYDLVLEEGHLNKDYGTYFCNWILINKRK